jgi:hypothetical protein
MSETPKIALQPLGDPDAETCVDGVCELPGHTPAG